MGNSPLEKSVWGESDHHMATGPKPPADVTIEPSLVRTLLQEQHTDLAHLPLIDKGEGWDNRLFRLGEDLAVWSVVPWFTGESALLAPPPDPARMVVALGRFLRALHQPAPDDAPLNPWRGVPLAARAKRVREHVRQLDGLVDGVAVLSMWEHVVLTPSWSGPPLWIHGDLHPGNLLLSGSRLSAVIDFGDLTGDDPATDLSVVWMLPSSARSIFLASTFGEFDAIDDDTWMRARGWALALGLAYMASSRDDEAMGALGRATIDAALNGV